ncbi:MAG: hypothetical protein IFNCLDLE_02611 [Ignavibacteriaceae bacterium]|nr:hypothetical protein [Ignavibacteriaceae bacterium]
MPRGMYQHKKKEPKHCEMCGKEVSNRNNKKCLSCYRSLNGINHPLYGRKRPEVSGENHPRWKGGVSSPDRLERINFRRMIQKQVLERDNYTCKMCGVRGVALQVDHIQPWAEYVEGRFDINNCRTLCMSCHYQITFGKEMPKEIKSWGHNLNQIYKEHI